MHSLSAEQLRSVCAANGLLHLLPKNKANVTKYDILRILERELYGDDGEIPGERDGDNSSPSKKAKAEDPDFTSSPTKKEGGDEADDADADVIILS
jgi:hypothetical protein